MQMLQVEEILVFHLLNLHWLEYDVKVIGLAVSILTVPGIA